jgi:hypothetical protein
MSDLERLGAGLLAIIREAIAPTKFLGSYRYRVAGQSGDTLDVQPVDKSVGLPDLVGLPVHTGCPGAKGELASGSVVLVAFADGKSTLPYVCGFEAVGAPGFVPLEVSIEADDLVEIGPDATEVNIGDGVFGAARQNDPVTAGPYAGTITMGSTKVKVG